MLNAAVVKKVINEAKKPSSPARGVTIKPDGKPGPELTVGRVFFADGTASLALDAFPTSSVLLVDLPEGVEVRPGIYGLRAPTNRKDAQGREVWVNVGRVEAKGRTLTFLFDAVPYTGRALADLRETLEEKKARRATQQSAEVAAEGEFGPEEFPEDPLA